MCLCMLWKNDVGLSAYVIWAKIHSMTKRICFSINCLSKIKNILVGDVWIRLIRIYDKDCLRLTIISFGLAKFGLNIHIV